MSNLGVAHNRFKVDIKSEPVFGQLSIDEANHYQKVIVALKETIRLIGQIDALIPEWPVT